MENLKISKKYLKRVYTKEKCVNNINVIEKLFSYVLNEMLVLLH